MRPRNRSRSASTCTESQRIEQECCRISLQLKPKSRAAATMVSNQDVPALSATPYSAPLLPNNPRSVPSPAMSNRPPRIRVHAPSPTRWSTLGHLLRRKPRQSNLDNSLNCVIDKVRQLNPISRLGNVALQAGYGGFGGKRVRSRKLLNGFDLLLDSLEERVSVFDGNYLGSAMTNELLGLSLGSPRTAQYVVNRRDGERISAERSAPSHSADQPHTIRPNSSKMRSRS